MASRLAAPAARMAARSLAHGDRYGFGLLLAALLLIAGVFPAQATMAEPAATSSAPAPAGDGSATTAAGIDPDWLSGAKEWIVASEYRFKPRGSDAVSAPNRAHNLRTHVTARGVEFEPRVASKTPFHLVLTLSGYGREGAVRRVQAGRVTAHESRANIDRPGMAEWYENGPRGVEQGFTLSTRPTGGRATGEAILAFRATGDLRPQEGSDVSQIGFADRDGRVRISFGALQASDANGKVVSARFALRRDQVEIRLADQDASYPITVDPIVTTESWGFDGQSTDHFALSVATAGDVNGDGFSDVIIGVPQDDQGASDNGSVYLFYGTANGLNAFGPNWEGNLGVDGAWAGMQVAPAGDVNGDGFDDFLVGERSGAGGSYGYVFLFLGHQLGPNPIGGGPTSGDWRFQAPGTSLRPSIAGLGDVNGDGKDDIMVGAPAAPPGGDQGRVYLWLGRSTFDGTTFTTGTTVNADAVFVGAYTNGRLGWVVATAGDVNGDGLSDALIGGPGGGPSGQGETLLYLGQSSGAPLVLGATLTGISAGSKSGYAVSTAGDMDADGFSDIIIGFPGSSDAGFSGGGGFTILRGKASAPYVIGGLNVFSLVANDSAGSAVATAGDINGDGYADIVVGSSNYYNTVSSHYTRGRADLYLGGPGALPSFAPAWTRTGGIDAVGDGELFGFSVATAGDVNGDGFSELLIGAPKSNLSNNGRAYLFNGAANLPGAQPVWSNTGAGGDYYGWSMACAGDVNADGYSDVVVGVPGYDNGQADEGRVLVYFGAAGGLQTSPGWTYESNQAGAILGISVASAGDVSNDGWGDIIVGAQQYDSNGHTNNGAAFVWEGYSFGLHTNPEWVYYGEEDNALYGATVASAGDVNGDGYGDVIVGAPYQDSGITDQGKVYAYYGSSDGLPYVIAPGAAHWTATGGQAGALFGYEVSSAGDVDGNGESDIVIGAPNHDTNVSGTTHPDAGQVYVYKGYPNGLSLFPARVLAGTDDNAQFGYSVAGAGDVNGDAYSDVIVGQPGYEGRALIYAGSPGGTGTSPSWQVGSGQSGSAFGADVASAGDLNGDGYSDVIVAALYYDNTNPGIAFDGGKAFVYYGGPGGPTTTADWTTQVNQSYANLGLAASAGDVNGDGFGDLVVSARGYNGGAGLAQVFYGNARGTGLSAGVDRHLNQWPDCFACTGPISPLGLVGSTNFRLAAWGRTPAGRGVVRMQWQIKGKHVPFDFTGVSNGTSFLTGAPGGGSSIAGLWELATLNPADDQSHWRMRIASRNPFFPRSPWMSLPYNAPTEADLRSAAVSQIVGVEPGGLPKTVSLSPSFPNPSPSGASTRFSLSRPGPVRLSVLDITGRQVRVLADRTFDAGEHVERWDGGDERGMGSPAGVYFFRLEAEGQVLSRATVRIR